MADLDMPEAGFWLDLYDPLNPALTEILNGSGMRAFVLAGARRMQMLYVAQVRKSADPDDLDRLALSTQASTVKTFTTYGPRWSGQLEVSSGHILPWEFGWTDDDAMVMHREVGHHDLNHVLEMIRV